MKTVIFDSRDIFLERQSALHNYFQKNPNKDILPVSVFHDYDSYNNYKDLENIEFLSQYWADGHMKYSKSELSKIEIKYGVINFWNIVASDRFISNWKESKIVEQLSFYFFAWESIIGKYSPSFIVSETISGLWNYVLFVICNYNKIRYLSILPSRNTGRYYYSIDQYGTWFDFEHAYDRLVSIGLSNDQVFSSLEYLKKFKEKPEAPYYLKLMSGLPSFIKYINFPRIIINLKKDIYQNWIHKNHDYKLGYNSWDYIYTLIKAYRIILSRLFKFFQKPDYDEEYILFPLHFQPEASTIIWSPYYSDQLVVIKAIARSLPFGIYLYVKEHYAFLGTKSLEFYKELKKIPNVKLIDPFSNVFKLIENSLAVTVITNTTGLEAIILNKPLIVFGKVFYDFYPYLYKVENINELSTLIRKAINQPPPKNDNKRLAFIYLYSLLGYTGDIFKYKYSEDEIVRFADDLLIEIAKNVDYKK